MNAGQWNKEIFYVDKSLIVKTFLCYKHRIQLVSAPQGFLKTSNLRLLASFFDINTDSKVEMKRKRVFENTKIMSREDIVAEYFGKFPTIFITFEHQESSYSLRKMMQVLRDIYLANSFLLFSSKLSMMEKGKFRAYLDYQPPTVGYQNPTQLADAVSFLCELLHKHYEKKVFVFVDNYDSPFLNAISNNRPMYNFLPFLERMLNNIASCPSLNRLLMCGTTSISCLGTMKMTEFKFLTKNKYVKHFGFTESDLQELAVRCSAEVMEDLKKGCYLTVDDVQVFSPEWVLSKLNYAPIENPYWYDNILKKPIYTHLPALKMRIRMLVRGDDVIFGINKYKSARDLWLLNKLLNGSLDEEQLEESEINLLLSLFLEFGLFTFTRRRRRNSSLSWSCLAADNEPRLKLVLNHTSRGSAILKSVFLS